MAETRPLVVTDDEDLLDDLLRLSAVSGTEVDVAPDVGSARGLWRSARLVLLGVDAAYRLAVRPARRSSVVLVGRDLDDAGVWELGVHAGAEHVAVLPDAESWLLDLLTTAADRRVEPAPLIAVVGGRGGAGATTLAVALAIAAAEAGHTTMLADVDPLGGGIDVALGGDGAAGARWDGFAAATGRLPSSAVSGVLPRIESLSVLTWSRGPDAAERVPLVAVEAAVDAGRRAHDVVVADLPRSLDPGSAGLFVAHEASVVLIVVPAELRATAAAARVGAQLRHCADVRVVVRGPSPGGLDGWLIADSLDLPLAGTMRAEAGLAAAYERGYLPGTKPRSPLREFARATIADLAPSARRTVA
jgi:secretion/DNA translocation related CpaE-like protein